MSTQDIPFDRFVVVIGWNSFGATITRQIIAASNRVVILTKDESQQIEVRESFDTDGVYAAAVQPSNFSKMKEIGVGKAHSVLLNLGTDEDNLLTVLRMKNHFEDLDYMVALRDEELEETFRTAGVTYAVSRFSISSKILASYLYEPDVAEYNEDLLTATEEKGDHDIQQYRVTETCPAAGSSFVEVMRTLRGDHDCIPIGLRKSGGELIKVPEPDVRVNQDDYVLLVTEKSSEAGIESYFGTKEGVINGGHK
jgi:voltage-gated potassium channel